MATPSRFAMDGPLLVADERYAVRLPRFPDDLNRIRELHQYLEVPYEEEFFQSLSKDPSTIALVVEFLAGAEAGAGESSCVVGVVIAKATDRESKEEREASTTLFESIVDAAVDKLAGFWDSAAALFDTLFSVGDPTTDPDNMGRFPLAHRLKGDPLLLEAHSKGQLQIVDCGKASKPTSSADRGGSVEDFDKDGVDRSKLGIVSREQSLASGGLLRHREGYLMTLAIDPRHRGQGLGKTLVEGACQMLHDKHQCGYVTLHCLRQNKRAQRLYLKTGFHARALLLDYYHFEDSAGRASHDALYMVRDLNEAALARMREAGEAETDAAASSGAGVSADGGEAAAATAAGPMPTGHSNAIEAPAGNALEAVIAGKALPTVNQEVDSATLDLDHGHDHSHSPHHSDLRDAI